MKRIGTFALCILVALMAFVAVDLTIHSGEVGATSVTKQAVTLLKNRYGITATPEEINKMDGVTATTAEINYSDGVTSNIQTQLDAKTGTSLADTKAYVGNASGVAVAVSLSLINDVTGSMDNSGAFNTTIPSSTITSDMIAIANVQASDIGAAAVNSPKLDKYTLDLLVPFNVTSNSVSGDASDLYTGALLTTIGGINGTNLVNDVYHDGFGNYIISMVNAPSADAIWTLGFINAN